VTGKGTAKKVKKTNPGSGAPKQWVKKEWSVVSQQFLERGMNNKKTFAEITAETGVTHC